MKYLKLFEGTFDVSDYYTDLSNDEWIEFNHMDMTSENINIISSLCNRKLRDVKVWDRSILTYTHIVSDKVSDDIIYHETINIYQYKEEDWFIIKYAINDWDNQINTVDLVKCDGIDGIKRFFKDRGLLK